MSVRIQSKEGIREGALAVEERAENISNGTYTHPNDDGSVAEEREAQAAQQAAAMASSKAATTMPSGRVPKVGRNEPYPCGSWKKYNQSCTAGLSYLLVPQIR